MARSTSTKAERADQAASDAINQHRKTWGMKLLGAVSDVGDQPQMRLLCGATIALGLVRGDRHLARTGFRMLAAHTVATWGKSAIKAIVDRTRPESGDDAKLHIGNSDAHKDNSFPSGHSAGALSVAQAFARGYPEHATMVRSAALLVAAVQVPRGTHYVGDVVAGTLIGLAAEPLSEYVIGTAVPDPPQFRAPPESEIGSGHQSHRDNGNL